MWDYCRLARPRILALVLFTMAAASLSVGDAPVSWWAMGQALGGVGLVMAGAVALNQRIEWRGDARMVRTCLRPVPRGALTPRQATCFGIGATVMGLAVLTCWPGNLWLTALTAANWLAYVAVYTPLKRRSVWQTPVGAISGALPIVLGATLQGEACGGNTWLLFALAYFWQFPHAMAIAWLYREQFAAAGVRVAPVVDSTGRSAGKLALLGALLLPLVGVAAVWTAGLPAAVVLTVLGVLHAPAALLFAREPNDARARWMLRASLLYLPAAFAVLPLSRWLAI